MSFGFSQSADLRMDCPMDGDSAERIYGAVKQHAHQTYTCTPTPEGCFLKPVFRGMTFRNSFAPEIRIAVSQEDGKTVLHLYGQPVPMVLVFMGVWLGFLALIGMILLADFLFSRTGNPMFLLIIPGMALYGYGLCKLGTWIAFREVLKAIRKAFPICD